MTDRGSKEGATLPPAWTEALEARYRLVERDYGVAAYRRADGAPARMQWS